MNETPDLPELLTCDEIATALKVDISRVWALIRAGELKAAKINHKTYRVLKSDFEEFIARKSEN